MRYHQSKPAYSYVLYGEIYICNHPLYDSCTLFKIGEKGIAVIQQKFHNKITWWQEIDPWLQDLIYLNENFYYYYFQSIAKEVNNEGLYPTVTVRQIMWVSFLKPIHKDQWETVFDRKLI